MFRKDSESPHETDRKRRMDVDSIARGGVCGIENEDRRRSSISNTSG